MRVQRGGGREDDEVHDQVREEHAGQHIVPGAAYLPPGGAFAFLDGRLALRDLFLYFLGGLPEEQVRRDGRPQDAHQGRPICCRTIPRWE